MNPTWKKVKDVLKRDVKFNMIETYKTVGTRIPSLIVSKLAPKKNCINYDNGRTNGGNKTWKVAGG